jgi:hypothetical protein
MPISKITTISKLDYIGFTDLVSWADTFYPRGLVNPDFCSLAGPLFLQLGVSLRYRMKPCVLSGIYKEEKEPISMGSDLVLFVFLRLPIFFNGVCYTKFRTVVFPCRGASQLGFS